MLASDLAVATAQKAMALDSLVADLAAAGWGGIQFGGNSGIRFMGIGFDTGGSRGGAIINQNNAMENEIQVRCLCQSNIVTEKIEFTFKDHIQ